MRQTAVRLLSSGFTVREVHRQLGIGQSTLRNWLQEPIGTGPIKQTCPRCHNAPLDGPAYAYLLGLYLGDGHVVHGRKDVFRLEIACCDDWPGLAEAAAQAVSTVMPANSVGRRQRTGCTMIGTTSKHRPCLFPQHGPGMKHTRKIALEAWQKEIVAEFTEEFIRGLIHSDGCRSMNRVRRPLRGGDRDDHRPVRRPVDAAASQRARICAAGQLRGRAGWAARGRRSGRPPPVSAGATRPRTRPAAERALSGPDR